jgi:hypothetical protein
MTEDKPHIVYPAGMIFGVVRLCPSYADAYKQWEALHHYQTPYLIATVGRVIDPSTPIIDPSE